MEMLGGGGRGEAVKSRCRDLWRLGAQAEPALVTVRLLYVVVARWTNRPRGPRITQVGALEVA